MELHIVLSAQPVIKIGLICIPLAIRENQTYFHNKARDLVLDDHKILIGFMILVILGLTPVVFMKRHQSMPKNAAHFPVRLFVHHECRIYRLDLEEYLTGVLAAEMPAAFEMEALKAQAVAARTLAIKRLKRFGGRGCRMEPNADVCDDPGDSQAWIGTAELERKWGKANFRRYMGKIRRAVRETSGEIMTFHNHPIDAVFHSTCGVGTVSAAEIWNQGLSYLQSESCGYDHESSRYSQKIGIPWQELSRRFKIPVGMLKQMRVVRRTKTGRVLWLNIGKQFMRGEDFRRTAGLNSTCFGWTMKPSGMDFTVIGYGHGVGMCQYGANGMAKRGFNYHQILQHYYRGIRFQKIIY
jgi:stage II sporulation protein D